MCGVLLPLTAVGGPSADALQQWIASHAVVVRSIDAADQDFSDLEPLLGAIGNARVVQLGEPSHGAGGSFAAKVRLIEFLHRRMGFDVVVWESGLYSLRLTEAALRGGEDAARAARRGIFPVWSATEEARPLFEYARMSQATTRPLEMAGFDVQLTGEGALERLSADLKVFVSGLHATALRTRCERLVDELLAQWDRRWPQRPRDGEAFATAADRLLAAILEHRAAFEAAHGAREVAFMHRVVENFRDFGICMHELLPNMDKNGAEAQALRNKSWNRRDAGNAQNLRWLIDTYYAGRKLVVWAHNGHIMNAHYAADWMKLHEQPQPDGMQPMGAYLSEWFGDEVYSIGFTAFGGEDRMVTVDSAALAVPQPGDETLEHRLHALGKPYVFLDLRNLDGQPQHALRKPQTMYVRGYRSETVADITRIYDALFFIDRMAPAALIEPLADPQPGIRSR